MGTKCLACVIKDLNDFIKISKAFSGNWIFRGQENSSWELQTSLERYVSLTQKNNVKSIWKEIEKKGIHKIEKSRKKLWRMYFRIDNSDEYHAIKEFQRHTKTIGTSNIEALCSMQHFGAATRLLDFSFSIGIALFFAIEKQTVVQNDRCIWCINTDPIINNIIANNPSVYDNFQKKRTIGFEDPDYLSRFLNYLEGEDYQEFLKKQVAIEITENNEAHQQSSVIPVNLQGSNDRINIQNGLFLFPTNLHDTFCNNLCCSLNQKASKVNISTDDISKLTKNKSISLAYLLKRLQGDDVPYIIQLRIPNSQRNTFMEICRWFNISTHTIYPDMDGAAKSVSYGIPKFNI